jgi:hypothetical protein
VSTRAEPAGSLDRLWWRRTLELLWRPRATFEAFVGESEEDVAARAEPLLAIGWLAGIAAVLISSTAIDPLDDFQIDGLVFAVWVFLAGGAYGFVGYWLGGGALQIGLRGAGSVAPYRLARHLLVFAAVPTALSLVVWPVRLALYGGDVFRSGGSDPALANDVFYGIQALFGVWSLALLALGVRVIWDWSWRQSLEAIGLTLLVLGLFAAIPAVL